MYYNYKKINQAIYDLRSFKGNSCKGYKDKAGVYHVISYTTEIYSSINGLSLEYYSMITSKLQGIISRVIYNKSLKQLKDKTKKHKELTLFG